MEVEEEVEEKVEEKEVEEVVVVHHLHHHYHPSVIIKHLIVDAIIFNTIVVVTITIGITPSK